MLSPGEIDVDLNFIKPYFHFEITTHYPMVLLTITAIKYPDIKYSFRIGIGDIIGRKGPYTTMLNDMIPMVRDMKLRELL